MKNRQILIFITLLMAGCMGALEFEPATGPASDENMRFEIDSLVEVAREALSNKEGFEVNLDRSWLLQDLITT